MEEKARAPIDRYEKLEGEVPALFKRDDPVNDDVVGRRSSLQHRPLEQQTVTPEPRDQAVYGTGGAADRAGDLPIRHASHREF
jgi:hypothetical protein